MKKGLTWGSSLLLFVAASSAHAHVRLTSPAPRSQTSNTTSPCAGALPGSATATYQPGQTVTVKWCEYIKHAGSVFEIHFSPDNSSYGTLLVGGVPYASAGQCQDGGIYSRTVTIPSTPCSTCSLQVVQADAGLTTYYSCADIIISGPDAGGPPDAGNGGCGPANCSSGCCDSQGICTSGTADSACGNHGGLCVNCGGPGLCGATAGGGGQCSTPQDSGPSQGTDAGPPPSTDAGTSGGGSGLGCASAPNVLIATFLGAAVLGLLLRRRAS